MSEEYVSLKPSDAVKGGGAVSEGRYKITDAKFIMFDYGGTVSPAQPSLAVEFTNADGVSAVQCYSAGDYRNLEPSTNGKRLRKISSATSGLNDSTNCFLFMRAAVNAGISEDQLGGDIDTLIGIDCDVINEAVQEREIRGKKVAARAIPVIGKIHATAGDKKAGTKGGTKGAGKANGLENTEALKPKAVEVLTTVLKEADGRQLEKKAITTAAFKKIPSSDTDRSSVLNLLINDGFLASLGDAGVLYDADKSLVMYVGE